MAEWNKYSAWGIKNIFHVQLNLGRLKITAKMNSRKSPMGRFGGGWDWELGVQVSRRSVLFNLLVMIVRFSWERK